MSGIFIVTLWIEAHKSAQFTIFASSLRGAFGKASRKLVSMEVIRDKVTCMMLRSKDHPAECNFKRYFDQGAAISPWIPTKEICDDYE